MAEHGDRLDRIFAELRTRPETARSAVTVRTGLRLLPLMLAEQASDDDLFAEDNLLAMWRVAFTAWAEAAYPVHPQFSEARRAAAYNLLLSGPVSRLATAVSGIFEALNWDEAEAGDPAFWLLAMKAVEETPDGDEHKQETIRSLFAALKADAEWLREGDGLWLIRERLWGAAWPSPDIERAFDALTATRMDHGGDWYPIVQWYRWVMLGGSGIFGEETDRRIALADEEFWERRAAVVIDDLTWIIRAGDTEGRGAAAPAPAAPEGLSDADAQKLAAVEPDRGAMLFESDGDVVRLRAPVWNGDDVAAQDATVRALHKRVQRLLIEFRDTAYGISNSADWRGFDRTYDRLRDCLDCETELLAKRVADFWGELCELGTWLERDDDLRAGIAKGSALDSGLRRELDNIIKGASPLLRRFPTGSQLDDDMAAYSSPAERFGDAAQFLGASGQAGMFRDEDRELLQDFIAAVARGDFQGRKLKGFVTRTARNLAIKSCSLVAAVYVGAVGSVVSTESALVQKAKTSIVAAENEITALFADFPADIRGALRSLLIDLKREAPAPGGIRVELPLLHRREEDSD